MKRDEADDVEWSDLFFGYENVVSQASVSEAVRLLALVPVGPGATSETLSKELDGTPTLRSLRGVGADLWREEAPGAYLARLRAEWGHE